MNIKIILIALSAIILISSCTSVSPTIRANINQSANFNQYKTFGFFEKLDTDYNYESLVSQYLKEATKTEMTKRGYVFTDTNPDLLINFHNNIEDKQRVYQVPAPYYSYRGRAYYDTWDGYDAYVDNYTEGTLNIDIVDRKQNKMVWEGIAIGRLSEEDLNNLQPTLQKTVAEIFSKFPL